MTDLIEKVARGMYPSWWKTIDTCTDGAGCDDCQHDRAHTLSKARAAIKAVAEWLKQNGSTYEERVAGESLLLELEDKR